MVRPISVPAVAGRRRGRRADGADLGLLPSLAAAGALAAATGLAWSSTFRGTRFVPAVVVAAILPCALVAFTARRLPSPLRALTSAGLLLAALAAVAGGLGAALGALSGGWADILTIALPVAAGDPLVVLAVASTWAAAAVSAELVASSGRPLLPIVPPVVCLLAALAVGAPGPALPRGLVALIGAGAAVLAATRASQLTRSQAAGSAGDGGGHAPEPPPAPLRPGDHPDRRLAAPGRLLAGAGVVVVVALAAAVVGPRPPGVDGGDRFDVRRYRDDPVLLEDAANPLAGFAAMVASPDREVAQVRGGTAGLLLRLAVLDDFDGTTWTSAGTYTRASTTLPAATDGPPGGDEVTVDIRVGDLDGFFLPAPDRPVRVSVAGLGVDPATGVLVAPGKGARGVHYEVTSRAPSFTAADLRGATQSRTGSPLPNPPVDVRDRAVELTGGAGSAFGKPAALVRHFQEAGFEAVSGDEPPSGSGYFALKDLFEFRRGTAEQYASAVAVLARAVGYDTRVVTGFRLPPPDGSGVSHVRTGDAHAWAEVRFQDLGWVRFDPMPAGGLGSGDPSSTTPPPRPPPTPLTHRPCPPRWPRR